MNDKLPVTINGKIQPIGCPNFSDLKTYKYWALDNPKIKEILAKEGKKIVEVKVKLGKLVNIVVENS